MGRRVVSGVLCGCLRTLLGREGVLQRLHFLVGLFHEGIYQRNTVV
jgi:hypothetical protein